MKKKKATTELISPSIKIHRQQLIKMFAKKKYQYFRFLCHPFNPFKRQIVQLQLPEIRKSKFTSSRIVALNEKKAEKKTYTHTRASCTSIQPNPIQSNPFQFNLIECM